MIVLLEGIEDLVFWELDCEGDGGEMSVMVGGVSVKLIVVDRMFTRWLRSY